MDSLGRSIPLEYAMELLKGKGQASLNIPCSEPKPCIYPWYQVFVGPNNFWSIARTSPVFNKLFCEKLLGEKTLVNTDFPTFTLDDQFISPPQAPKGYCLLDPEPCSINPRNWILMRETAAVFAPEVSEIEICISLDTYVGLFVTDYLAVDQKGNPIPAPRINDSERILRIHDFGPSDLMPRYWYVCLNRFPLMPIS